MKGFTKGKGKGKKFIPTSNDKGSLRAISKEDIHKRAGDVPASIGNQDLIRKKKTLEEGLDEAIAEIKQSMKEKSEKPLPERDTPEWNEIESEVKRRVDQDFNDVRLENVQKIAGEDWYQYIETTEPRMEDVKDHFGERNMSDEEFEEAHGESEIDDAKDELRREQEEIMWGTVFEAKDGRLAELIREHADAIINDIGMRIIDLGDSEASEAYNQGVFLGVNGAGYDFYESHWIPLYRLFGWV